MLHRKFIIFWSKQCIVFKLSHKMYFCTTYNNCFVNAVIKSIVLYQKVNFVTFWKHWRKTRKLFFKYGFLMIKHRLNTVKHRLLVEKDRGNACRKNQDKKTSLFFWRIFLEVSVFTALAVLEICNITHNIYIYWKYTLYYIENRSYT